MIEVPNIDQVRRQTAESGEEITQQWVNKLTGAIGNGIWQQAKGGHRHYEYLFDDNNITHKCDAMGRVMKSFQDAGYTVKCSNHYYIFSW